MNAMNIFNKIALQNLRKNRARTFATIVGVILSTALLTGIVCFVVSLQNYMVSGAIEKYGDWEIAFTNADQEFIQSQEKDSRVKNIVSFSNIGYARLSNGKNPDKPYAFLAGFNDETLDVLPLTLISGRMPENEQEVVIPSHLASNGGVRLSIGDSVSFEVGERVKTNGQILSQDIAYLHEKEKLIHTETRTYTVVGICQRPSFEDVSSPGYTLITKSSADITPQNETAFVGLNNPADVRDFIADGDSNILLNDNVLRFLGLSEDTFFNTLLYTVVVILVAIVLIGSVCLIYNAFNMSLGERMQQLGVLLSVGATPKQLRYSVLFEGLCIGCIGIPLGLLVGIPAIAMVLRLASEKFNTLLYDNIPLNLQISPKALGTVVALSILIILISALIPAHKALKKSIMDCIRQQSSFCENNNVTKSFRIIEQVLGFEGSIALKNFKRNKKRYRSVIASLILSILLFVSASSFSDSLHQTADGMATVTNYDVGVTIEKCSDETLTLLYDSLKNLEGISDSNMQAIYQKTCHFDVSTFSDKLCDELALSDSIPMTELNIIFEVIDDKSYENLCSQLKLETGNLIGVAKLLDNTSTDMFKQKNISVSISEQSKKVTLVDSMLPDIPPSAEISNADAPYFFQIVVPWSEKNILFGEQSPLISGMTFTSDDPQQTTEIIRELLAQYDTSLDYTLMNVRGMLEENQTIRFIVQLFSGIFIGMITLIAVANVFNTIATNIRLRRRELAMLRSVGMGDHAFSRMMKMECAFYGIWTLIFGLPLSLLSSVLIRWGMSKGGSENLSVTIPWDTLAISVLAVFVIIFLTMQYATHRIKKENIIDALRDDLA